MCNLYRMTKTPDEVAKWFNAENAAEGANLADELYRKSPGLVVADGSVRNMTWGFPRKNFSKRTGKPIKPTAVNNARKEKLEEWFWRESFANRRCLIPLSAWCEAEGDYGSKTRTWLSVPDAELFAVAGIWRDSDEWGACYSMVMVDSVGEAAKVHNRMPVILSPDSYDEWCNEPADAAKALCQPWQGNVAIDRTQNAWSKR